jgi:hypothetical protein
MVIAAEHLRTCGASIRRAGWRGRRICIMTPKRLDVRLSWWLFKCLSKPLLLVAPFIRTNYLLQGDIFTFKRPFRSSVSLRIEDFDEIGAESTDQGPFAEDMFWILKRGKVRLRIGDPHPMFKQLMERFGSLPGFNWLPFIEAQSCTRNRYFVCWRKSNVPNRR